MRAREYSLCMCYFFFLRQSAESADRALFQKKIHQIDLGTDNCQKTKTEIIISNFSEISEDTAKFMRERERERDLVDHLVLEDGGAIENFHGDTLTSLRVLSELDLREGSFSDRPPHFVLPYLPHHHLSLSLSLSPSSPNS